MARHLEQQANELPVLKIHPKSVFLIVYPGGHCGEFLAWWMGLHPGCVRTQIREVDSNRYIWQPSYRYELSEQGTRDKLFLTTHPGNTTSKCGFAVPDFQQHISLYSNARYRHFFYYLFLFKTYFFKYRISDHNVPGFFTTQQWQEFLKYLGPRDSFYYYEAESWINNSYTNVRDFVYLKWDVINAPGDSSVQFRFDVGEMFFGDTERESQKLLRSLDIDVSPKLFDYLREYHRRNIAVIEKYTNTNIDQLLSLDIGQSLAIVADILDQRFS